MNTNARNVMTAFVFWLLIQNILYMLGLHLKHDAVYDSTVQRRLLAARFLHRPRAWQGNPTIASDDYESPPEQMRLAMFALI